MSEVKSTLSDAKPETKQSFRPWKRILFATTLTVGGISAGAYIGRSVGEAHQQHANQEARTKAEKIIRCRDYIASLPGDPNQVRIVRTTSLSESVQINCGLKEPDIFSQLPSPHRLDQQVTELQKEAETVDNNSILKEVARGAFLGLIAGGFMGSAGFVHMMPPPEADNRHNKSNSPAQTQAITQ